jgi:hypothetical protein
LNETVEPQETSVCRHCGEPIAMMDKSGGSYVVAWHHVPSLVMLCMLVAEPEPDAPS